MSKLSIINRINSLRLLLKDKGMDAYIIPTTDFHGSEYVNPYFHAREFMSGFDGSAGTLLVTLDEALLWTDGRYFIQAAKQLEGTGIQLMKMGEPDVPTLLEYIKSKVSGILGFDGRLIPTSDAKEYQEFVKLAVQEDLVDLLWEDRPILTQNPIYALPLEVTGESSPSKLKRLRQKMKSLSADYHLVTKLEEIAWLTNLRGSDVSHTPVFYSFMLISQKDAKLYLLNEDIDSTKFDIPDGTTICPYWRIIDDLTELNEVSILLDEKSVNYRLFAQLSDSVKIISRPNTVELMMAVKNPTEISCTKNAHIKDGVAMVNFLYWLKANTGVLPITELSAADYLEYCRSCQKGFMDLSFDTICGYGPNGAIIHYSATPQTSRKLESMGFVLVDSGGHYEDGTTDITRTIALGPLTQEEKERYTLVLKCHIQLAMSTFSKGTTGAQLDEIARKPLKDAGLNFNHGTGHGVGHILSVHEGPQSISPRGGGQEMLEGIITSNEPGFYLEDHYGIRLENEILCVQDPDHEGSLAFETITLCPFDKDAIIFEMLTEEEYGWLVDYNQKVYESLSPHLDELEKQWLKQQVGLE